MNKTIYAIITILIVGTAFGLTGDGEPWHALQQVSTDASGSTSVDADASGRVDSADDLTCTAGNCIQSAEIQDNQISSSHLTANSVTSGKIVDGTILAADLEDNGQTELDGQLLAYDSSTGGFSWSSSNGVTGSGSTNYLPLWTGASTLGNSILQQSSNNIGIGVSPSSVTYGSGGTHLDIRETADGEIAQISVMGNSQGSGIVFVGQSSNYGGGIAYNGDNTPAMATSSDHISIFRRTAGTDYQLLHWPHNSDQAEFEGPVDLNGNNIILGGAWLSNDGGNEGIAVDNSGIVTISNDLIGSEGFSVDDDATDVYDDGTTSNSPYSRIHADAFHTNGIGVGQLYIEGRAIDTNSYMEIGAGKAGGQSPSDVRIGDNNEIAVDTSTNRVGILDTSPSFTLDVAGYVNGQSGVCIAGTCKTEWEGTRTTSSYDGDFIYTSIDHQDKSVLRITPSTGQPWWTGMQPGYEGQRVLLMNAGSVSSYIWDEYSSAAAANRFALFEDVSMPMYPGDAIEFVYSASRWRQVSLGNQYEYDVLNVNADSYSGKSSNDIYLATGATGKVGIHTTSPSHKLTVAGDIRATASIDSDTNINADGIHLRADGGVYDGSNYWKMYAYGNTYLNGGTYQGSDARLKKDIRPIEDALDSVMKIEGVYYNWRSGEYPDRGMDNRTHIGIVAQDIEEFYPEVVLTDMEGYKAVTYAQISPILIEAVKELNMKMETQIQQLQQENSMLKQLLCEDHPNAELCQ